MKAFFKNLAIVSTVTLMATQAAFANAPLATAYASGLSLNLLQSPQSANSAPTLESLYSNSEIQKLSVRDRAAYFAKLFLERKTPYVVDPLGEGPTGILAQGPLYRFDGFDCTTFVETVMALALSKNPQEFKSRIIQIRYKNSVVDYVTRNHFTSVDWIPNNIAQGFIKDITQEIAGPLVKISETSIDKAGWYSKKGGAFSQLGLGMTPTLSKISYISKNDLINLPGLIDKIPSGSIFSLVRPNWDLTKAAGTHLDVSHQGWLIRENGVLYMYHASNGMGRDGSDNYMGVKKEALSSYISRVMLSKETMGGFNILALPKNVLF